jgi:hypothetical protein
MPQSASSDSASFRPRPGHVPSRGRAGKSAATLLLPVAFLVTGALLLLRLHFQPPTVPPYAILGAAGTEELELRHGGTFEMDISPLGRVGGAVAARAFFVRDDTVRPWNAPFVVARDGSVRIGGPVDALFADIPPGRWEIAVAVGRPETLPTTPLEILRARDAGSDKRPAAWQLVRERVRLLG